MSGVSMLEQYRRLADERAARIRVLRASGLTVEEIAALYRISRQRVYKVLQRQAAAIPKSEEA